MVYIKIRLCVISLLLIFISCQDQNKKLDSAASKIKSHTVKIVEENTSNDTLDYIAPIFPIGQLTENESISTLILTKGQLAKKVEIVPIGMFSYQVENEFVEMLLSVEVIDNKKVLDIENFLGFSTEYASVKQIIEIYFSNRYGLGKVKSFKWMNELAALRKINLTK